MTTAALRDVCAQDRATVRTGEDSSLRYLGLESIEAQTGRLVEGELSKTPESPQANSFRFDTRHVLYAKLRPYLNKVFVPTFEGKCSTELVPLLPAIGLDRSYLAYFLRSESIVTAISAKTAGARMPRADMDFVFGLQIPLPPLPGQRRIVDVLARAEGLVRLHREAVAKTREIIPALFLDMFGDPATNPKGWEIEVLGQLADIVRGSSPRPQGDPRFFGGPIPRLMIADITRDGMIVTPSIDSLTELGARSSRPMLAGAVVVAVSGNVGLPAILTCDACIHDGFVGFRQLSQSVLAVYLYAYLLLMRERNSHQAVGAIWKNLTTDQIKTLQIPLPPLALQTRFTEHVARIRGIQAQAETALAKAQATFQALLHRVFAG